MQKFVRSFQTPLWIEQFNSAVFQNQIKKWQYCYLTKYVCTTYSTVLSTLQCGVLYYLHSTPTIYLFIQLSKRHVCTQLSSFCLFPCFFDPCVKQVIFSYSHCMYCMSCTHKLKSHAIFCLFVVQHCSQVVLTFSRHILFLSIFFVSIFLCSNSLSFHSAVYSNSILLLHTYDMQIML